MAVDLTAERVTYLVIDGENIDGTLGLSLLGHRPAPEERPRWERVLKFAEQRWGHPVRALFFINASSGSMPTSFVQALVAIGMRPIPLSGPPGVKVVDVGIHRTLEAIVQRPGHVILASHDGDFLADVDALLSGERQVALLAFREYVNSQYLDLTGAGLEIFDLEEDARCFNVVLPRIRIIDIESFDPTAFL
jgi:uncharacterized protein